MAVGEVSGFSADVKERKCRARATEVIEKEKCIVPLFGGPWRLRVEVDHLFIRDTHRPSFLYSPGTLPTATCTRPNPYFCSDFIHFLSGWDL